MRSCEKVSCDRGYVIIMATGNSFTKFMLIVCGIVLMTAAFSGCTDVNTKGDGDSVSATAEEPSPTPSVSNQALYKQITDPAVVKGAMGEPLDNYRIPASVLGTPDDTDSWGTNVWYNVEGFDEYTEYRDDDGRVEKITFDLSDRGYIALVDKEKNDQNIDLIDAMLSDGTDIIIP